MSSFFPDLRNFISTVARVVLVSRWRNILKHPGLPAVEKCIIVGNGPSFRETMEEKKEILMKSRLVCVNMFSETLYYKELKPEFYIISAPIFFLDEAKISQTYIDLRDRLFESLAERTSWRMFIMVPFVARASKEFQKIVKQNPNIIPLYFNTTAAEGYFSHFFFRKGFGMPRPHNVLIPAIMNMMKLGYKDISLIGADHSWLTEITVNEKNEALVNQKHFYDENESKPLKMEDYIVRPRRLHEMVHKFYLSFKGYWDIRSYAEKRNVKIFNSSKVSMIDAFERKSLD